MKRLPLLLLAFASCLSLIAPSGAAAPSRRLLLAPRAFNAASVSGLILDLDASDASTLFTNSACTTLVAADGDPVGCWRDRSGRGTNATQSTSSKRPLFKAAIQNGRPGLLLDGVDDTWVLPLSNAASDYTVFMVLRGAATGSAQYLIDSSTGRTAVAYFSGGSTPNVPAYFDGAWRESSATETAAAQVLEWDMYNGAGSGIFRNGVSLGSGFTYTRRTFGGTTALGSHNAGLTIFFSGYIDRVDVYARALSLSEKQYVRAGLKAQWGTP